MRRFYAGDTVGTHTFPSHFFPEDGRGAARVLCACGTSVLIVNIDTLPTEEPE